MSNVSTEMPSNVLMIEDREWGNVGNFMAVVSAANGASGSGSSGNRTQQTPMFENLALPGPSTQPSSGGVLALPPPTTSTVMDQSLEPVMTVAIPTDMSVVSTQTGQLCRNFLADNIGLIALNSNTKNFVTKEFDSYILLNKTKLLVGCIFFCYIILIVFFSSATKNCKRYSHSF